MTLDHVYVVVREIRGCLAVVESVGLTRDRAVLEASRLAARFIMANPGQVIQVIGETFYFPDAGVTLRIKKIAVLT